MRVGLPSRLTLRIAIPALAVAALALGALYYRQGQLAEQRSAETLDRYAGLLSNLVLHDLRDSMLRKERPRIQRELADVARLAPIRSVQVVAKSGRVAFASDPGAVGRVVAKSALTCVACHQQGIIPTSGPRSLHTEVEGRSVFRALQPIFAGQACLRCHEVPAGTMLGVLVTDIDGPALTGAVASDRAQTVALGGMALLAVVAAVLLAVRSQVLIRLGGLTRLLELLRSGAHAAVHAVGNADEIDDLARAVQALTLDLDGRIEVERTEREVAAVLARSHFPALLCDPLGRVLAANEAAQLALTGSPASMRGFQRYTGDTPTCALHHGALADGWAVPDDDEPGPAVVALADPAGRPWAQLEVWGQSEVPTAYALPSHCAASPDAAAWRIYAAVKAQGVRSRVGGSAMVLQFDARLALARRLAADLATLGGAAAAAREPVDLKSMTLLVEHEMRKRHPSMRWLWLTASDLRAVGSRPQLRALFERLAQAAAQQAGLGGEVVLLAHDDAKGEHVFVGAWCGRPGGEALVDEPSAPPLALTVARAHGGAVEVDGHFNIDVFAASSGLDLRRGRVGTLYVAQLPVRAVPRFAARHVV